MTDDTLWREWHMSDGSSLGVVIQRRGEAFRVGAYHGRVLTDPFWVDTVVEDGIPTLAEAEAAAERVCREIESGKDVFAKEG